MRYSALMALPIILGACTGGSGVGNDPCESRECGVVDGKDCGSCPGATEYCDAAGQCVDACVDRECGEGAQGILCGSCTQSQRCNLLGQCYTDDSCPPGMVAIGDTGVCIDALEVTNAQYVPLLEAHGNVCNELVTHNECILDRFDNEDYKIYYDNGWHIRVGFENHPVVGVTFFGARVACEHWGKHLCTGEEWRLACEGPLGLTYPYGNEFDMSACNTCYGLETCVDGSVEVGSTPDCEGGYAHIFDMNGNVDEWVDDCRGGSCYTAGGTWVGGDNTCKCNYVAAGIAGDPVLSTRATGFRCCYYLP